MSNKSAGEIQDGPAESSAPNAEIKPAIESVLRGILGRVQEDNMAAAAAISDLPAIQAAQAAARSGDFDTLWHSLLYPFSNLLDGILEAAWPGNDRAQFLLREQVYVRSQFDHHVRRMEGSVCHVDKTDAILWRLFRFLVSGKPIVFDATEKFTFHHPKTVFTTHESIVSFFDAVHFLHAGQPDRYLAAINSIYHPNVSTGNSASVRMKG